MKKTKVDDWGYPNTYKLLGECLQTCTLSSTVKHPPSLKSEVWSTASTLLLLYWLHETYYISCRDLFKKAFLVYIFRFFLQMRIYLVLFYETWMWNSFYIVWLKNKVVQKGQKHFRWLTKLKSSRFLWPTYVNIFNAILVISVENNSICETLQFKRASKVKYISCLRASPKWELKI